MQNKGSITWATITRAEITALRSLLAVITALRSLLAVSSWNTSQSLPEQVKQHITDVGTAWKQQEGKTKFYLGINVTDHFLPTDVDTAWKQQEEKNKF